MSIAARVQDLLTEKQIPYELIAHPQTNSSSETATAAHVPEDHIAKGVVLKEADSYLLAVIPASQWVALHRIRDELDRAFELAPEEEVDRLFPDCQPGAVPPFGAAYRIPTVLDEALTSLAKVYFEAGDHRHLVAVRGEHFQALVGGARHGHFSTAD